MRIQHNIAALNSYRNLGTNNTGVSKNLEKLSSGFRINRAGDDAAGLAISEKMRSQITGLNTATKNANDGISLVQTAEGALTEVHSMLNRMVEIATQSSNGVYEDTVDRAALQDEMNALTDEIDRISEGTNFNKKNLLDGSIANGQITKFAISGTSMYTVDLKFNVAKSDALSIKISYGDGTDGVAFTADNAITITFDKKANGKEYSADEISKWIKEELLDDTSVETAAGPNAADQEEFRKLVTGMVVSGSAKSGTDATASTTTTSAVETSDKEMNLQIGDTNDDFNKLGVNVRQVSADTLGLKAIKVSSETDAGKAVDVINRAINMVSTQRGQLGAIQNRLEHTINNLSVNAENMTAAESRIRDVDMADEMMKYTKNNILVQASQAMLAQANQVPQGVLQLLQ